MGSDDKEEIIGQDTEALGSQNPLRGTPLLHRWQTPPSCQAAAAEPGEVARG